MPSLRELVDGVERRVAAVVDEWIDDPRVAEALLGAGKLGAAGLRTVEDARSAAVHLFALPARSDVRALSGEVARLRVALAEVTAQLDELRDAADGPPR